MPYLFSIYALTDKEQYVIVLTVIIIKENANEIPVLRVRLLMAAKSIRDLLSDCLSRNSFLVVLLMFWATVEIHRRIARHTQKRSSSCLQLRKGFVLPYFLFLVTHQWKTFENADLALLNKETVVQRIACEQALMRPGASQSSSVVQSAVQSSLK